MKQQEPRKTANRPYPWICPACLKVEVVPAEIAYTAQVKHDAVEITLDLPQLKAPQCRACGELVFTDAADEQISDALRAHLALLTPAQIRLGRKALQLTENQLAERLGVPEATISQWETGSLIQSRPMDNLLRVYFALPEVRAV